MREITLDLAWLLPMGNRNLDPLWRTSLTGPHAGAYHWERQGRLTRRRGAEMCVARDAGQASLEKDFVTTRKSSARTGTWR